MKTISFELSDEAFDLLQKIGEHKRAEYSDYRFKTLEEWEKNNILKQPPEHFLNRNFGGTLYLIDELFLYNLIEDVEEAWKPTYKLSELGKQVLEDYTDVVGVDGDIIDLFEANLTDEEWKALATVHKMKNRLDLGVRFDWNKSIDVKSATTSQIVDETVFLNR